MKIIFLLIILASSAMAEGNTIYVSVRESKIKSRAEFLSSAVSEVKYGDALTLLKNEDPWLKVKSYSGKEGYVHSSVVNSKKIVLNSGAKFSNSANNSEDSIILAGKGFNEDVEKQYEALNKRLNYSAVNKMEHTKISLGELKSFVKDGGLKGE